MTRRARWTAASTAVLGVLAVLVAALGAVSAVSARDARAAGAHAARAAGRLPPIKHVFVIMLENESYSSTFGRPADFPYLAGTLVKRGALLTNYYATGHASADNYISIVSGQPPNPQTQGDCTTYTNLSGGRLLPDGVQTGSGCVYPAAVKTIGNQLTAAGESWKAYEQDMGNDRHREAAACGHPALGQLDPTQQAAPGDGYAARHDPFIYFHSVIDNRAYCDAHVVALGSPTGAMPPTALRGETGLATDLKRASTTPAFSFITPNLCNDGHDFPCTNQPSGASPAADIDSFLKTWVPKITGSPAFKQGGLLEITFDEAEGDSSACCGEVPAPGGPSPGDPGPGGGKVGAVLISPYIKGGTVSRKPYNHYSSLASWEQLFGLRRLADAATVTSTFGADVFTNYRRASHRSA